MPSKPTARANRSSEASTGATGVASHPAPAARHSPARAGSGHGRGRFPELPAILFEGDYPAQPPVVARLDAPPDTPGAAATDVGHRSEDSDPAQPRVDPQGSSSAPPPPMEAGKPPPLSPPEPAHEDPVVDRARESVEIQLLARDPYTLYASWPLPQLAGIHRAGVEAAVFRSGDASAPIQIREIAPDTTHAFLLVPAAGERYRVELRLKEPGTGHYHTLGRSNEVGTPVERLHGRDPELPELHESQPRGGFVDRPAFESALPGTERGLRADAGLSWRDLEPEEEPGIDPVPLLVADLDEPILEQVRWAMTASAEQPVSEAAPLRRSNETQPAGYPAGADSESISALLREGRVTPPDVLAAPATATGEEFPSSPRGPGIGESSLRREFWLEVNADLVVYGATEPGARVRVGGQPIAVRPDGTFEVRFAFPDGAHGLSVLACSADGLDGRSAKLDFSRETAHHGSTSEPISDPGLGPPSAGV